MLWTEIDIKKMVGDNETICSGHDSVDTSATCRIESFDHRLQIDENDYDRSNNHAHIGSMNTRLSLEAIRQDELKSQTIVNALNAFILQAGNIYKGNKLSTLDANRLRDVATEAGLSIKVVDALLKQTADQNAIKEDPQLSRVLLENDQNDREKGCGLNVSNSVWRIFMHKIIKQFLKEQNMQLTDIFEKSSHTRRLYEEALGYDSKQNNKFDTSILPRDYSEERKHVFITEAEAKQARMEASEAMMKFQQYKNASVYDLFNGASIESHREFPALTPHNTVGILDSRDDDLSMVPCASERESLFIQRVGLSKPTNSDLDVTDGLVDASIPDSTDDDFSMVPCASERESALIQRRELRKATNSDLDVTDGLVDAIIPDSRDDDLSVVLYANKPTYSDLNVTNDTVVDVMIPLSRDDDSSMILHANKPTNSDSDVTCDAVDMIPCTNERNVSSIRIEPFLRTNNNPSKNSLETLVEREALPTLKKIDPEINNKLSLSPYTPKKEISPVLTKTPPMTTTNNTVGRTKTSSVKRRIAMYERGPTSPQSNKDSPQIKHEHLEQDSFPSGNILQARAIFEKNGKKPEAVITPNRKIQNKNIQHVLATWTQKEQDSLRSAQQTETGNYSIGFDSMEIEKRDISKKYLEAVKDQDFFDEDANDVKSRTKLGQSNYCDALSEEKTSPRMRSECKTKGSNQKQGVESGTQRLSFNDTRGSESKFEKKLVQKPNQMKLRDVNLNEAYECNDGSDDGDEKGLCLESVLQSTDFPLDQNLDLYSTDETEDTDQEPHPDANFGLNKNQIEEDCQEEGTSTPNMSASQMAKYNPHTKTSDKLTFLSSVNDYRQSSQGNEETGVFHEMRYAQNDQYLETPLSNNYSIDESEDTVQEPNANCELKNIQTDQLDEKLEIYQKEGTSALNMSTSQMAICNSHAKSADLMFPSSVKDYRQSQQGSGESGIFHMVRDAQNDQCLENPLFDNVCECDMSSFNNSQIIVIDRDLNGSLAYASSASDDGSRIPIPPLERSPRVASVKGQKNATTFQSERSNRHQYTEEEKCDRLLSHPISESNFDLTQFRVENTWAKFESKNSFRDQYHEENGNVRASKVESAKTSNYHLNKKPVDHNAWTDFESKNMFGQQSEESSPFRDIGNNMERIVKVKYDGVSPDLVPLGEISNNCPNNESEDRKVYAENKDGRAMKKSSRGEDIMALTSPAKASQEIPDASEGTNSAPFAIDPYPKPLYYHKKSSNESMSEHKIEKRISFVENVRGLFDFPVVMENGDSTFHIVVHETSSVDRSPSKNNQSDYQIPFDGQNKKWTNIDEVNIPSYTSVPLQTAKSKSKSNHSETFISQLNIENQSIVSEPKNYFADLLGSQSSSSILGEASCDAHRVLDPINHTLEHCVSSIEETNHSSLIGQKVQPERLHDIDTNFKEGIYRDESWEKFTSDFEVKRDDCATNVPSKNSVLNRIHSGGNDVQQLGLIRSLSSSNEVSEKAVDPADSLPQSIGLCGPANMRSMNQSSNPVDEKITAYLETKNITIEHSSDYEERELSEDERHVKNLLFSRNLNTEDSRRRKGLDMNSDENSSTTNPDFVNGHSCSEKMIDAVLPSIPPRDESTYGTAEERSDFKNYKFYEGAQASSVNEFSTTNPLSMKDDDAKLASGNDYCITLSDRHSIRDHDQGIRDFLEQRGDLLEECVEQSRHSLDEIETDNVQQGGDISAKRDRHEALNAFLTVLQLCEKQEGNTLEECRHIIHRDHSDRIEQYHHSEVQNCMEGNGQRDGSTAKNSDMTPWKNNVSTVHQDRDAETLFSTSSEMSLVDMTTRTVDEDERNNLYEVSWPIDDAKVNREGSSSVNKSSQLQMGQQSNEKMAGDLETASENGHKKESNNSYEVGWPTEDTQVNNEGSQLGQYTIEDISRDLEATSENGHKNQRNNSYEDSWPIDDAKVNRGATFSVNKSADFQMDKYIDEDIAKDFETASENSLIHPKSYNVHSQRFSKSNTDITNFNSSDMEWDSTEHLKHQNEHHHRQNRRNLSPIIRVLDRPLLDLDDSECCFDAIEVERQNSNDSLRREPEPSIRHKTSNTRSYKTDPKPDPKPDPSPKGLRRESIAPLRFTDAPEGATKEELKLLNQFIDVASSNFGGNTLSAESESRVRSAALKVGLTSKFVDQLLSQTTKKEESLTFEASQQRPYSPELQQAPFHDQEKKYQQNHPAYHHNGSNIAPNDCRDDHEAYYTTDYCRTTAKQSRSHERPSDSNWNVWESLGKNFGFLASMTAKACGVEYHTGRDDASSVVSAISWEDNDTGPSKAIKSRSGRPREADDRTEDLAPTFQNDEHHNDRTRRVSFATDYAVQVDRTGQESNAVHDDTTNSPPRAKIRQLV